MFEGDSIKISVIIPAYQAERTLESCVCSVLHQTLRVHEIIIVDDGSTDKTYEIALRLAQKDKRIVTIHQVNKGAAAARNAGLKEVHGDYIAFIDSDDTIKQTFFEELARALPANIVVTKLESKAYTHLFENNNENRLYSRESLAEDFEELYINYFFNSVCGKLYSTTTIENQAFPEEMRVGEDLMFNLQVFSRANVVVALTYVGYIYNPNIESTTHRFNSKDFDQQIIICNSVYRFATDCLKLMGDIRAIDIVYLRNNIDLIANLVTFENHEKINKSLTVYYSNSYFTDRCQKYSENELMTDFKRRVFYILIRKKKIRELELLGFINKARIKLKK